MTKVELVLDARAELAEGPSWFADRNRLLWVDIMAGQVHLLDPMTGHDLAIDVGQPVGAAVPALGGRVALALRDGFALLNVDTGAVERLADVETDVTGNRMNDGKSDRAGRFWAGTMALDGRAGAGSLYRLDAGGQVQRIIAGVGISNGVAWSPDDRSMYYVDSPTCRVDVFDFDLASGRIANRRPFVRVPGPGVPDGIAVDAEGGLWVAVWGGGHVLHFLADGTLTGTIKLPASRVTSCCFGGPDLGDLFITTAWKGMGPDERAREPMAGGIFRSRPGVVGQPTCACAASSPGT